MPEQREHTEFAANSRAFEGCERTNVSLEAHSFVRTLQNEIADRISSAVAATSKRKQARGDARREFTERRTIGLQRRHQAKSARRAGS